MSNYVTTFALKDERAQVDRQRRAAREIIPAIRTNAQWRELGDLTRRLQILDVTIYSREHTVTVPNARKLMRIDAEGNASWPE